MSSDTQNPGGWPDAAYITAVADAVFDATGLVLGYVTAAEMARFVQARVAAARREGIEAAASRCDTREVGWGGICGYREQEAADCAAAIRALMEDAR